MKKQPDMVYCKEHRVKVDLRQGFRNCIEENQCFSDDPCPWSSKFHQPPDSVDGAVPVSATPDSSGTKSP